MNVYRKRENYKYGVLAENKVANHFKVKGYTVLKQRYKTQYGEIDLILQKGDELIFLEVKARSKMQGEDLVSKTQKERNCMAALYFLSEFPAYSEKEIRFDCIFLDRSGRFKYFQNAWEMIPY